MNGHMMRLMPLVNVGNILDAAYEQMRVACLMPLRPRSHPETGQGGGEGEGPSGGSSAPPRVCPRR
jgi:hypothetical protein